MRKGTSPEQQEGFYYYMWCNQTSWKVSCRSNKNTLLTQNAIFWLKKIRSHVLYLHGFFYATLGWGTFHENDKPRDPITFYGMVMEPKYLAFRRWLYTPCSSSDKVIGCLEKSTCQAFWRPQHHPLLSISRYESLRFPLQRWGNGEPEPVWKSSCFRKKPLISRKIHGNVTYIYINIYLFTYYIHLDDGTVGSM